MGSFLSETRVHFMQRIAVYANDRFWPKADIRTESKSVFFMAALGGKADVRVDLTPAPTADAEHTLVQKNDEIAERGGLRGTFRRDT